MTKTIIDHSIFIQKFTDGGSDRGVISVGARGCFDPNIYPLEVGLNNDGQLRSVMEADGHNVFYLMTKQVKDHIAERIRVTFAENDAQWVEKMYDATVYSSLEEHSAKDALTMFTEATAVPFFEGTIVNSTEELNALVEDFFKHPPGSVILDSGVEFNPT
jgi:hypothetical protein